MSLHVTVTYTYQKINTYSRARELCIQIWKGRSERIHTKELGHLIILFKAGSELKAHLPYLNDVSK
jgi:hypothetical protein